VLLRSSKLIKAGVRRQKSGDRRKENLLKRSPPYILTPDFCLLYSAFPHLTVKKIT
jgi:hypothetical protein